ncbi:hypothetical protein [Actinacidiphila glaucinigra]|uniref:hypothetical protein n=1 Tax=Actinacidiphila glaucinigra TaxID=235986 RepID=UPI0036E0512D
MSHSGAAPIGAHDWPSWRTARTGADPAHGLVVWGWAWLLPVFVLDRRPAAARRRAQDRVVARMEARLTTAAPHAPGD